MKSQNIFYVIIAGFAVLFVYLFSKSKTPTTIQGKPVVISNANTGTTALALSSATGLVNSFANLFKGNQSAIDASAGTGYTPNAPPLAAGLGSDQNFIPTSGVAAAPYGPGLNNVIDSSIPVDVPSDSALLALGTAQYSE